MLYGLLRCGNDPVDRRPRLLTGQGARQTYDKGVVLQAGETTLDRCQHTGHITPEQGRDIEPQTWKSLTAQETLRVRPQAFVLPITEHKPIHRPIEHAPHHVVAHTVASVRV